MNKIIFVVCTFSSMLASAQRTVINFDRDWTFFLGNDSLAIDKNYDDSKWRKLNLPHDWSIEGNFSKENSTTFNEGGLPAGIGWYRKTFTVPASAKDKKVYINFDGVYKNSEVWINGFYLGKRPNGYVSFRYELTDHLLFGNARNVITVKVDNSAQPDSRWYSGSGIYRNVWLITTNKIASDQWETFVTTPVVNHASAIVRIRSGIRSPGTGERVNLSISIMDAAGKMVCSKRVSNFLLNDGIANITNDLVVPKPKVWSIDDPYLYTIKTVISSGNLVSDESTVPFGIRTFYFDAAKGFFLNRKPVKILGVCDHHELGALGAAVNKRAIERQLEILKAMGCNAIRTAHNPPAPELLDLCDQKGFIVMDEAFDMWLKKKNKMDYHIDFEKWHRQDLQDQVKRDRNHPCVFMWSIGNEIREQFDSTGTFIARELVNIIKELDTTRPVMSALTENDPKKNFIYQSHALDLLGFNYKLNDYDRLPIKFPGQKFIASETMSALATRGIYDMPSDSMRIWPPDSKPGFKGNDDHTVSAYDHAFAYWGSNHETGWNAVKKRDFIAGLFVWSGFDFLGEPVPYQWPSRSSYYGIIDLAGFPKDAYYMYQSEWTKQPVLHIFPHWNYGKKGSDQHGDSVDVWAYYNNADAVELFLNGRSLGKRKKQGDTLHVMWRVKYEPGTLNAKSTKNGKVVLSSEIRTAGAPAKMELIADRKKIRADGQDLTFVTVKILDKAGNLVPNADNLIHFTIAGEGFIAGVDNGLQTDMDPFKSDQHKAFNGLCLAIVQARYKIGKAKLTASSTGLTASSIIIDVQ